MARIYNLYYHVCSNLFTNDIVRFRNIYNLETALNYFIYFLDFLYAIGNGVNLIMMTNEC